MQNHMKISRHASRGIEEGRDSYWPGTVSGRLLNCEKEDLDPAILSENTPSQQFKKYFFMHGSN